MSAKFAIFRRENGGGYSSRGPVARKITLEEARLEMKLLKKRYPHHQFVIMGEIEDAAYGEEIAVPVEIPERTGLAMNGHPAQSQPH